MKKRVLLTSLLTIALCFSLMLGATYALFTSESKVNIAVTSGKIEAVATVSKIELFSMDVLQADTFENGGTVSVENNELKLDKMTPGDKAVITINVKNNSNVKAIWRFVYECTDGYDLMSGMIVSINDAAKGAVKAYNSAWVELGAEEEIKISYELPVTAGNEYQDLSAKALLKVEAVQGNAGYTAAEEVSYISKAEGQNAFADAVAAGAGTVLLGEGTYKLPASVNGKAVEVIGNGETEIDATQAQGLGGAEVTLTNVVVKGTNDNYKGFQHAEKVVYNDCVFNYANFLYATDVEFYNCEFNLTSQYIWTYGATNVLFKDCTFNTEGKAVLIYAEGSDQDQVVTFEDCEFYASKAAYTWDGQHVAAIEIDGSLPNGGEGTFTLNVKGEMLLDSNFNGLYRIKKDATPSNVTVNDDATVEKANYVLNAEELQESLKTSGKYFLLSDIEVEKNLTLNVANGVNVELDLCGNKISSTADKTGNQELFLVKGDLTVVNGEMEYTALNNQGWNSMATIFDVTAGGVLKLDGVKAKVSGTDMNFIVHLNNWGEVTLDVNNCEFTASYVAIRAFNSGNDMNNVTVKNSKFYGGRVFWVHNYTSEGKGDATLNLDIYNNNNTTEHEKPVRFGFSGSVYYDINGNVIQ